MLNNLNKMPQDDDSHSSAGTDISQDNKAGFWMRVKNAIKPKSNGDHLREALEDYLEDYIEEITAEENPELKPGPGRPGR